MAGLRRKTKGSGGNSFIGNLNKALKQAGVHNKTAGQKKYEDWTGKKPLKTALGGSGKTLGPQGDS